MSINSYSPPKTPTPPSDIEGFLNGILEEFPPSLSISELIDLSSSERTKMLSKPSDIANPLFLRIGKSRDRLIKVDEELEEKAPRIQKDVRLKIHSTKFSSNRSVKTESRHSSYPTIVNGDEIAEVLQSEAAFTIATDKKPILATYGCRGCVALGGYEATNKIAFMAHIANGAELRKSMGMLFQNLTNLTKQKIQKPIQLHLRGGIKGQSEATIKAIKVWMKQRDDLPMEIVSEDILDNGRSGGKSLSIDSRTGSVSEYHPRSNPKSKGIRKLDELKTMNSAFEPKITLAYSPK